MSLPGRLRREEPETDSAGGVGAGIIIGSELRDLWIPRPLAEFARSPSLSRSVRTHAEWRRFLEAQGRTDLWYAITARAYLAGGRSQDLTSIRWICADDLNLEEFHRVLASAAGRAPLDPDDDFSTASVHVLDEESSRCDPRAVMREQLRDRSPTGDP